MLVWVAGWGTWSICTIAGVGRCTMRLSGGRRKAESPPSAVGLLRRTGRRQKTGIGKTGRRRWGRSARCGPRCAHTECRTASAGGRTGGVGCLPARGTRGKAESRK